MTPTPSGTPTPGELASKRLPSNSPRCAAGFKLPAKGNCLVCSQPANGYCSRDYQNKNDEVERLRADRDRLREKLARLGSMEAFVMARAVDADRDEELIARIDFAREALQSTGTA